MTNEYQVDMNLEPSHYKTMYLPFSLKHSDKASSYLSWLLKHAVSSYLSWLPKHADKVSSYLS